MNGIPNSLGKCQLLRIKVIADYEDPAVPDNKNTESKTSGNKTDNGALEQTIILL
jgi:hypothetical protein